MATPEKVFKAGIQREPGWLYYFDNGNIMRTRMVRGGQKKKPGDKPEVVLKTDVKREDGFIYYLDKQGDVSRSVASRGGTARKKKRSKKAAKKAKKKAKKATKKKGKAAKAKKKGGKKGKRR
jgi:hypothetical protein